MTTNMKFSLVLVLLAMMAIKVECSSKGNKSPKSPKSAKSSKSEEPSATPSISLNPSQSSSPSSIPSDSPSMLPSEIPSDSPSMIPSSAPSGFPSLIPSDSPSMVPSDIPSNSPSVNPSESSVPSFEPSDMPSESPSESSAPSFEPSKSGKASKAASQKTPTVSKAAKSPKSVKEVALAFYVNDKVLHIQNDGGNTVVLTDCNDPSVCYLWQQQGKYLKYGDAYLTIEGNSLAFDGDVSDPTEWKIKDEEKCMILYTQPEGGLRNVVCANNSSELVLVSWEYRENDSPIPPAGVNCCLDDGISSIE